MRFFLNPKHTAHLTKIFFFFSKQIFKICINLVYLLWIATDLIPRSTIRNALLKPLMGFSYHKSSSYATCTQKRSQRSNCPPKYFKCNSVNVEIYVYLDLGNNRGKFIAIKDLLLSTSTTEDVFYGSTVEDFFLRGGLAKSTVLCPPQPSRNFWLATPLLVQLSLIYLVTNHTTHAVLPACHVLQIILTWPASSHATASFLKNLNKRNQIFIILAVLRRSV